MGRLMEWMLGEVVPEVKRFDSTEKRKTASLFYGRGREID